MVNVSVFDIASICIHGRELLRQFTFHQKYIGKSLFKEDVRDIWTVDIGTIEGDFWSVSNQLGKFSMEAIIFGQWWRSHQSLACKGLRILRFCVMPWKYESEPNIEHCLGMTVGLVQRFITLQNTGHNRRRIDGIRVEYFPRIHHIGARPWSSWAKWANPNNAKDELSSCRCSMTSFGEIKTMKRNLLLIPHLWLYSQKDFQQDVGHSSDLGQKQSGSPLTKKDQEEKWDRVAEYDDDQIRRKWTPSFPSQESVVWRNAQKQRRWKIIYTLLCRWWYDWNCFSHNNFCQPAQYLRSSLRIVWRVQYLSNKHKETCCGRTICPIVCANKLIDNDTHIFGWDSCTRKFNAEAQRTRGKPSTTRSIDKSLYWRWQNILTSSYNLQSQWHVVSILCHEMKNQLTRKVGFKGTPKLDPCWKSQPVTYKVNMEWKSELHLWTTTILTRGLEYLTAWTIWSQTWSTGSTTTTSKRPPQLIRKLCCGSKKWRWLNKWMILVFFSSVHCRVLISEADFLASCPNWKACWVSSFFFRWRVRFALMYFCFLYVCSCGRVLFEVNRCFLEFICANDASCTLCLSVASQHMTIVCLLLVAQLSTCT